MCEVKDGVWITLLCGRWGDGQTFIYNNQHFAIKGKPTDTMRRGRGNGDNNSLIQFSTIATMCVGFST